MDDMQVMCDILPNTSKCNNLCCLTQQLLFVSGHMDCVLGAAWLQYMVDMISDGEA